MILSYNLVYRESSKNILDYDSEYTNDLLT